MKIFINGKIMAEDKAVLTVKDRGFLYGDAVFETFRVYEGKIPFYEEHINRLEDSIKALKINRRLNKDEILFQIEKLLKLNRLKDAVVKVMVSRGDSKGALNISGQEKSKLIITVSDKRFYPKNIYKRGITLYIPSVRRIPSKCLPASIKSHNYLNFILARIEANEKGADDALLKNIDGYISETSCANFFFVKGGKLFTPSKECDILEGITRNNIIKIAKEEKISLKEGKFNISSLKNAEECFVTNSVLEIMPVSRINQWEFKNRSEFNLTLQLQKKYHELILSKLNKL